MKSEVICQNCGKKILKWPSQIHDRTFCSHSCCMTHTDKTNNPSWARDLSGKNNPMYGISKEAWNKGIRGEKAHNWKGGLTQRKDGYFRIRIDGKRFLYHRYLLRDKLKKGNVVHHLDHNPSNNDLKNLKILKNQSEHVKFENK
jgi:hypothetical protein